MCKNNLLWVTLLIFHWCPSWAQVVPFDSVRAMIIAQNPTLKSFQNQALRFDAMAEGAKAWEAPQIGVGFFMTPYQPKFWQDRNELINGMRTMMPGMGNVMVQAKQMIPNPARLKANQRYQKALSSIELENARSVTNELLFQAKSNYVQIQILDRKLTALKEAIQTLQTLLVVAEKKIAYGQETLPGVYKTRARAALLEKDQSAMKSERIQQVAALQGLMQRPLSASFTTDTLLKQHNYELARIDSSTLLDKRSDILAMSKDMEAMQLKWKAELAKNRPDFGLEYGHMFAFGYSPNQFTLMGMMSIPIAPWSSKMAKASAKAIQHEIEAIKHRQTAMATSSLSSLRGLQTEIASAKYQLKLYKEMILPSLQKAYESMLLGYANNTGELLMVLDARLDLQMAQMQYWDSMWNLQKLQIEYEKQMQLY